jgi:hypothetical protein
MQLNHSSNPSGILLAANGATIVSDTATYAGLYYAVHAITDCVVNTATFEGTVTGSLNGLTIKAGDTVMLYRITSFKLTSGSAILYVA